MAVISKHVVTTRPVELPSETLETLRGDCARMAPHWVAPAAATAAPVSPALIHGVTVPTASARLIDGMSEYGD
ncbi:hypothetical protein OG453_13880 [Streptomyces sp. NBC_01381]|uniref:hypothetical protein n=1 Tax=Streptomyces sp. NBC_01381 TaxID=2903845 RepID=UPI002251033B|nr:hypothetical protein [Streptomyces sp. NBC_01381]MCX4667743.1 hypothetical protein [Streptomyces sp. NBC_01381]